MGAIRRSRNVRPKVDAVRLTERDSEILHAVGRMKVVTSHELAALFFGDRSTASRRLARLVGAGLLKVRLLDLNHPNLYVLTRKGFDLLVAEGTDPDALHLGAVRRGEGLEHLLRLNDVRVALELEARTHPGVALDVFLADHDLRRAAGANPRAYIPDALVRLRRPPPAFALGLAIEVDLGTEAPSVVATTKGAETFALAKHRTPLWGLDRWRIIFVAPSEKRLRSVARALHEAGVGSFWFGSDMERIRATGLLGPSWLSMTAIQAAPSDSALPYGRAVVEAGGAS